MDSLTIWTVVEKKTQMHIGWQWDTKVKEDEKKL